MQQSTSARRSVSTGVIYQGGPAVEVFTSAAKPTQHAAVKGQIQRVYERAVKSFCHTIEGSASTKLQLLRNASKGFGLVRPYLCCRWSFPKACPFQFELAVTDAVACGAE